MALSQTQRDRIEASSDREIISSEYVECPNCGHDEKVNIFYDTAPTDRMCTNCRHYW